MKKLFTILMCAVSGLTAQTTQLRTTYCNYNSISFGEFLAADSVIATPNATNYQFRVVNVAEGYNQTFNNASGYPYLAFYVLPGLGALTNNGYGITFTVDVRWSNNGGSTWSAYGPTCTITSPTSEITQISSGDCGATYNGWNNLIHADQKAWCSNYEYRFWNAALSYTQSFVKTNNNVVFSQFTGLANSTTYSVDVRLKYLTVWSPYGSFCQTTTPPAPTTSLTSTDCNSTPATWSSLIHAETNVGDSVAYRLWNAALSYTQTFKKTNFNFVLTQFTGLQNSTTYSCDCSIRYNGTFGPYGNPCTITTPAAPTTQIVNAECNTTATSYTNQLFHCDAVTGFQCYYYNFFDGVNTYTLEKCNNNNFNLSQLTPTVPVNTTYTVTVKVKFNNTYGPFGNSCTITTPVTYQRPSYPNPFTESTEIEVRPIGVEATKAYILKVYDKNGKLVEQLIGKDPSVKIGKEYPEGLYNVIIIDNDKIINTKVIKQ